MPVNVKFGADTGDLEDGIARAQDALKSFTKPVDDLATSFDSLATSGAGVSTALGALLGGGAIAGGIGAIFGEALKLSREMVNLERNAKEAGLTLQKFQEYKFAANQSGVSDNQFVADLQNATNKLNDLSHGTSDLSKFLDANNVKYKEANGELISTDQYIQEAARLIANAASEGDKFKAASLLGFSRQWVQELEKGTAALRETLAEADRVGAVVSDQMVHRAAEFSQEWDKTAAHWKETMETAVIAMTPFFDGLIAKSKTILDSVAQWALKSTQWGQNATPTRGGGDVPSWFSAGEVPGAGLPQEGTGDVAGVAHGWLDVENAIKGSAAAATAAAPALKNAADSANPAEGGKTVFPGQANSDEARAAITAMQAQIQAADLQYQNESEKLTAALAMHTLTESQKTAATVAAINQREAAEEAAISRAAQRDDLTLAEFQTLQNRLTAIQLKAENDRQKAVDDGAKEEEQKRKAAADQIANAFDSQLRNLLTGATTWSQAMKSISADLVLKMIEDQLKVTAEFLANKAHEVAVALTTETAKTTATTTGAALRAGAEVASGETSILSVLANALKSIFAGAATTAAGTAGNVAPEVGPAAPAIGAAAGAAVVAEATGMLYDVGTNYVVRGGLAVIHPGETIIPAGMQRAVGSGPFTSTGRAGVPGDQHLHFHISTPNTRDMARALMDNGGAVIKSVKHAVRRGAHLPISI